MKIRRSIRGMTHPALTLTGVTLAIVAVLVLLLWKPWSPKAIHPERSLILYCAAGIMKPVVAAAQAYEKAYGVNVQIEPGGSGKLLSKIRVVQGRGDLYLAADRSYTRLAKSEGLTAESAPVSRIHPLLAVAEGNPKKITVLRDLLKDGIRVVLANPKLASIGKLGKRLLEPSGLWRELEKQKEQFKAKVSFVGTVNQVAQNIKLGAADAGIVWDPLIAQFQGLEGLEMPELQKAVKHVTLAVLSGTKQPTAALQFLRYLTARERGQQYFAQYHFTPIEDADEWSEHPELLLFSGAMLKPGIEKVLKAFEQREGVTIKPVFNGCGILVAQMKALKKNGQGGAFPDGYFSCDVSFMKQVRDWFEASTIISKNDMVICVQKGNPKKIQALSDFARPGLKIGLAHPVNSALGKLTDDFLKKMGLRDTIYNSGNKVVQTNSAHMLVNQLRAGSLDAGVVYRSNVMSNPANLEHLEIVEIDLAEAIATQPFAIAKNSKHKYLMKRLLAAILSPATQKRFETFGWQWIYRKH